MHPPTVSAAWPREGGEVAVAGGGHAVTGPLVSTRVLATRAHSYPEHSDLVIFNIFFLFDIKEHPHHLRICPSGAWN